MAVPAFHEHKHPRLHRVFYDFHDRGFIIVNDILAFFTILSVIAIVLETIPSFGPYHTWIKLVEYVSVGVFTVEYVVRLYAATHPLKYALSFFGIVDLVSILPTYFGLGNFTPLKSARMLRVLRFLRLVRFSKIARLEIETHRKDIEDHASIYRFNIVIYFFVMFFAVLVLGSMMSTLEIHHSTLGQTTESMLWVFTVLVGAPVTHATPETLGGTFLGIVTRFTGLIMLGFLVHIVGDVFQSVLFGEAERKKAAHKKS
jgi:voltage-gated potassium channel